MRPLRKGRPFRCRPCGSRSVQQRPRPDRPDAETLKRLERVTAAAFGQRRKMLPSSLKTLGGVALCETAGIEPDARAEVVDGAGFLRLAAAAQRRPQSDGSAGV